MVLAQNILLVISVIALVLLATYTARKTRIPGSRELLWLILSLIIWTLSTFMEAQVSSYSDMLLWRNIEQIGVFLTPLSLLSFSAAYAMNRNMRIFARVAAIVEGISLLLLFTDTYHHLMRTSVEAIQSAVYGNVLVVHSTALGSLLVAFNFCLALVSIGILLVHVRKVAANLRLPIWILIFSMAMTFVLTLLKASVLERIGVYIPMSVLYMPCVLLFSYALFRSKFLGLSPIARNKVFDVIDQGILVLDATGTIIDYNSKAEALVRDICPAAEVRNNKAVADVLPLAEGGRLFDCSIHFEQEYAKPDGSGFLSLKRHSLGSGKNDPIGYVLVMTDITAQRNFERQLRDRAETDSLTGAYNREGLSHAYIRILEKEENLPVSLFVIDIDHFKRINDAYGHLTGDRVLEDFVQILGAVLHREDIVGRLGGDEFVAILPHISRQEAFFVAEKVRNRAQRSRVRHGGNLAQYTVSIGITDCQTPGASLEDLLNAADRALYQAKERARNCSVVYPPLEKPAEQIAAE